MQAIIFKLRDTNLFNNVSIGDELQLQRTLAAYQVDHREAKLHTIVIDEAQTIHAIYEVEPNGIMGTTYTVLSAFHNGISERTTYYGLHRGVYGSDSIEKALEVALGRCEGKHKVVGIFDNLEKALQFIPDKYKHMVASDSYYAGRQDGYWVYLKEEFFNEEMGCQTIHEYTQKDVLRVLKSTREITLQDAINANYTDMIAKLTK